MLGFMSEGHLKPPTKKKVESLEHLLKLRSRTVAGKASRTFRKKGEGSILKDTAYEFPHGLQPKKGKVTAELYGDGCGESRYFTGDSTKEALDLAFKYTDDRKIKLTWIDRSSGEQIPMTDAPLYSSISTLTRVVSTPHEMKLVRPADATLQRLAISRCVAGGVSGLIRTTVRP